MKKKLHNQVTIAIENKRNQWAKQTKIIHTFFNTTRTGKTCTNFYDMHINQCLTCTSFPNYTTPQLHFKLHFTPDSCYYYKDRLGQSNKQILRSDD